MKTNKRQPSPVAFWLATITGVAITMITGGAAGHFSQRWGPSAAADAYATQLVEMPRQFGDWQMVEEKEMSPNTIQMLECQAYISREYRNEASGQQVSLAITFGPTGPISVHTPEVCYSSREFTIKSDRRAVTVPESDDREHTFWQVDFAARRPLQADFSVFYAWTNDGVWQAANSPRYNFASSRTLFKLQLASSDSTNSGASGPDTARTFLTDLAHSGWTVTGGGTVQQSVGISTDN